MSAAAGRGWSAAGLAPLGVGVCALVLGTVLGWDPTFLKALVAQPELVRAILVGVAVVAGIGLLVSAVQRLGDGSTGEGDRDLPGMVRGIRLSFLALAAFAAAAGWVLAHPLPIVVALIIAGVDVIETSFLLLVVTVRRR
jgi:hypothetical protein